MDSPLPLQMPSLEELPEARRVRRPASRALKEDSGLSPDGIVAAVTTAGALVALALVGLLLY